MERTIGEVVDDVHDAHPGVFYWDGWPLIYTGEYSLTTQDPRSTLR